MKKNILSVCIIVLFVTGCAQKIDLAEQNRKCESEGKLGSSQVMQRNKMSPDDYSFNYFYSSETSDCLTVRVKKTADYMYHISHSGKSLRKDQDIENLFVCSEYGVWNVLLDKFRGLSDLNVSQTAFTDDGKGGPAWDLKSKNSIMTQNQCFVLMQDKLKELKIPESQMAVIQK